MKNTRILLVEDEAIVAFDLSASLKRLGYEVAGVASTGEQAVALALELRPNLVLMDISLHGYMDGIEAAEAIHRRSDVPVIYLTAHSDADTFGRAKISAPFGYILKPFDERELALQVELALYKHQAERQIREQREWLRVTLASIGEAVIAGDADGRIRFLNPVAQQLTGWSEPEAMGRPLSSLLRVVSPRAGPKPTEPIGRVLREGVAVVLTDDTVLLAQDDRTVPVGGIASPIVNDAGQVVGTVLVLRDVTEKRDTERVLRESREDLNRAQAVGQIGSWRMNVQRNELHWSDESHRIFGIPKGTPLTYETFLGTVHPDDRDYVHERWTAALRGEPYDIEHRIVSGEAVKWVRERAELELDAQGTLLGGFGTTQDISELKRAQEAIRESEARFKLLSAVASRLLAAEDPLGIVHDLAREVMAHLDCQAFFNFVVDDRVGKLRLNAYAGIPEGEARKIEWLDYGGAVCGCVARDGGRIVSEEISSRADPQTELLRSCGIQACACEPLMARGMVIGTLSFGTNTRSRFSAHDLDLVKTVADQVVVALERTLLIGELQKAREQLEVRVLERTRQLALANQSLEAEIAQREDAERILREKNALLGTILSTVHFLVAFLDKDFRYVQVNEAYARAEHRLPEHFVGRGHFELHPDAEDEAIFRGVLETGSPFLASERPLEPHDRTDGTRSFWDWGVLPVKGEGGETTGLVLTRVDVTERRQAQQALRESEELLRSVLENMPVGVWITDETGRISIANPAARRIWGGAHFVGLERYGEYKGWWADTGRRIEAGEWALARAITRGEVSTNEIIDIECFDGTRKTILNSAFPTHNERGGIARAIVINQDITDLRRVETELRQSEDRLRRNIELLQKVVDGMTEPLIMLDKAGRVTTINRAAMDYYGSAMVADFLGKPCFEGLRGREAACPGCNHPFPAVDRQPFTFERTSLLDPSRVESVTIYPVLNDAGEREAVIIRCSDVTQAKLLERQIVQNEKLAALGLMTSGIAHEINNPNSFITFNIPILRRYLEELMPILDDHAARHPEFEVLHLSYDELKEDVFKLLENMEHGSQRINNIVGTLRSFVKKRGSGELHAFDLGALIDKVVTFCQAEIRRKVRSLDLRVPEDLPPMHSDPEDLEQVLLNLLINAVHACDKNDSRIGLKVDRLAATGEVVIEVSDNGSGIEEALLGKVFDPFFTTKPAAVGTGLGLYICHHHVESLGGTIEVESRVGRGSTFRVRLPRKDVG